MDDEKAGILEVGEFPVIRRRDAQTEADHTEAMRSGRRTALQEVLAWTIEEHGRCGPYDDTRPWIRIRLQLADMIRSDDGA